MITVEGLGSCKRGLHPIQVIHAHTFFSFIMLVYLVLAIVLSIPFFVFLVLHSKSFLLVFKSNLPV